MKVSVVIPCFNYGKYIVETIESVEASTYENIEIVVVDDGSTDDYTINIIQALKVEKPWIVVVHQRNKGLPAARNSGIKAATGELILPLDADDLIDPTFIEKAVWVFKKYPWIKIVYSYVRLFGEENLLWETKPFDFNTLLLDNYIPATAFFPKSVWQELGGYDETLRKGYEDWEFWLRIASQNYSGHLIQEPLFYYRKHSGSMLSESNKHRSELVKYISKKYSVYKQQKNSRIQWQGNIHLYLKSLYKYMKPLLPSIMTRNLKKLYFSYTSSYGGVSPGVDFKLLKELNATHSFERQRIGLKKGKFVKGNIAVLLPWLEVGGVENVYYELLKGISSKYNVILITTVSSSHVWLEKFKGICPQIYNLPSMGRSEKDQIDYLLDILVNHNIDIVQISNSSFGYTLTPLIKKIIPRIRIIDHLHMEEPYEPWDYFRLSEKYNNYLDHRVVITDHLRTVLNNKYGVDSGKIEVIENGIGWEWNSIEPSEKKGFTVAFIGRFVEQKDPVRFVKICRYIENEFINNEIDFVMIGDGPLYRKAKRAAFGIKNVRFLGKRDDVKELLLNNIQIVVSTSLREGLPMLGIESMAAGAVLIVNDTEGWRDLVDDGETGFLVRTNEPKEYAALITRLFTNRELLESMKQAAWRKFMDTFTAEVMVSKFETLYQRLLQHSNAGE